MLILKVLNYETLRVRREILKRGTNGLEALSPESEESQYQT